MQPSEISEFLKSLEVMIGKTAEGTMTWDKANPTTYVYDPVAKSGKFILQKVTSAAGTSINFQVVISNAPVFEAHGNENRELHDKLKSLYSTVEKYRDIKGLNILKSILP